MIDETRTQKRLRLSTKLQWRIEPTGVTGPGEFVDVSIQGARLILDGVFEADANVTLTLEAPGLPQLPSLASLRWHRRLQSWKPRYLCGVRFIEPPGDWADWIDGYAARSVRSRGVRVLAPL